MSYASVDDMIRKFGQREMIALTDNEEPYTNQLVVEKVEAALASACSLIDGHLATRFAVPIRPVPIFLREVACDLARWELAVGESRETQRDVDRRNAAMKVLDRINKGDISLGISSVAASAGVVVAADGIARPANSVEMLVTRPTVYGRGDW